ncbi:MAG: 2-amino-4-hydroxy-6-hydroxymethyldihydropteridine diphosphokinase [Flavobacteriales bacterium]|nr:2-amino-4-hydroxy-6-hydroxymethyldihydropteridine diphosphokinase [Flavobacteriales bacterium]
MRKGLPFLLLLGADLGDPPVTFAQAGKALEREIGPILARSRDHWTEAVGFPGDRPFLNRALVVEAVRDAHEVMRRLLIIESGLGRVREVGAPVGPRRIDIDILLAGGQVIDRPGLRVPHPRMHVRHFALAPSADIVPEWRHPLLDRTVLELLRDLEVHSSDAS